MDSTTFLNRLDLLMVPAVYRTEVEENLPEGWRFYRKGKYIFAAVPYSSVPPGDYGNGYVKNVCRNLVFALPLFWEKGLFLLYYGPADEWRPHCERHKVDKTALRPIILQSIHYVDPATGENHNVRTAWGDIQFGYWDPPVAKIRQLCDEIAQKSTSPAND